MSELIVAQPRAPYAARPPLVVDASVLAAALFGEEENDVAKSWMRGHALPAPADGVYAIATHYDLSAYDASYLWLAVHLRSPLATFDQRLGTAARECFGNLDDPGH
ncbi:MAG: type II toxin-antitoxin system VapC family toxin [Burkholderiales bacterium]|nr:type II toxin-antitoxin system VapC family toxin [Burkholderiales bacterium]